MLKRFDKKTAYISLILPAAFYLSIAFLIGYIYWPYFYYVKNGVLITVSIIAIWRYSLLLIKYTRALIYSYIFFPKLKKEAMEINEFPNHIYFIIPSYKEEPWVSREVFTALFSELNRIPSNATLIVSVGSDEDEKIITTLYEDYPLKDGVDLTILRQSEGKRVAMGHSLRAAARHWNDLPVQDKNSVTILMDGDSYISVDTLKNTIPFFKTNPKLGALTTNEVAYIHTKSNWYKDWFNLKFGQRHVLFQSQALSKKVLTLTGRFSMFRTSIVMQEDFIHNVENDILVNPYYGKFRFLMGDDKSTWFYLMKHNYDMLYIPDVVVYSLESRNGDFFKITTSLPFRWYGNTLRNNERARKLKHIPPFIRYLLYDQIFSMWTPLAGIVGMTYLAIFVDFVYLPMYIAWVLIVRTFQMFIIVLGGHPVSFRTIPLMLYNQWVGAIIRINAYFHLSSQKWSKNSGEVQTADGNIAPIRHWLAPYFSNIRMYFFVALFLFSMLILKNGILKIPEGDFMQVTHDNVIYAVNYGVKADDKRDDSKALNDLIKNAKDNSVIMLPKGQIDIYKPIVINRSNITIQGNNTVIVSHLHTPDRSAVIVEGKRGNTIGYLTKDAYATDTLDVKLKKVKNLKYILIEEPNDENFVKNILKAEVWYKKYPILRSEIAEVTSYTPNQIKIAYPIYTKFDKDVTTIKELDMVTNVTLRDFTLKGDVDTSPYKYVYKNLFEDKKVDGITFKYAANSTIFNVNILDSGSNPLVFERSYNIRGKNLYLEGALNKGKKGNGYLRINKSFHIRLEDITLKYLRHLTIQWASAYNYLYNIHLVSTDINFHGGNSHHNRVELVKCEDMKHHKWGCIYHTPQNAKWAPPDGVDNLVVKE